MAEVVFDMEDVLILIKLLADAASHADDARFYEDSWQGVTVRTENYDEIKITMEANET